MIVLRQPACKVTLRRNLERSQLTQCVVIAGMLGDILSMDVYRLSDSTYICVPRECQALLAEMGWLQATVVYIYGVLPVERHLRYKESGIRTL